MTILCFIGFNWHPAEGADVGNWQKSNFDKEFTGAVIWMYIAILLKHTKLYDILHLCSTVF
jgi:hypothetical protein